MLFMRCQQLKTCRYFSKVVTSTPSPKDLDVLPNIDLDISSICKPISVKSLMSKYEEPDAPIASHSCTSIPENDIVTIIEKIMPLPQSTNSDLCKSSKRLSFIFGSEEVDLINDYNSKRKLLKKFPNDQHYKSEYGYIVAQIEIKLSKKQTEFEERLRSIERDQLQTKKSFNLIPTHSSEKEEYNSVIDILKAICCVKREL